MFFGDGASNEGSFHEALNLASVWELPVIFVCENNLYAISNHISNSINIENIAHRGASYGIQSYVFDGFDAVNLYQNMDKLVRRGQNHSKLFW